jgi:hypothetical protein
MSAGPAAGGFAYFAIAKFIGYTAFCRWVIEPRLYENATLPASALSAQPLDSLQPVPHSRQALHEPLSACSPAR